MTLVKFNPVNGQLKRNSDNFLSYNDLWNSFFYANNNQGSFNSPKVNIREEAGLFEIEMAVPGLSKKDVKINIEKDLLTISHNFSSEINDQEYSLREFNFSSFEKSFHLPDTINTEKIEAKMNNGILHLILPKKDEAVDKGPFEIKVS